MISLAHSKHHFYSLFIVRMFSFLLHFVSLSFAGKLNKKVETKLINEFHRIYLQERISNPIKRARRQERVFITFDTFKEHDPDIDVIKYA